MLSIVLFPPLIILVMAPPLLRFMMAPPLYSPDGQSLGLWWSTNPYIHDGSTTSHVYDSCTTPYSHDGYTTVHDGFFTRYAADGSTFVPIITPKVRFMPMTPPFITIYTGPNQTWEIGRFRMITRRYVGNREEKITTEYDKLPSLICFVHEFPKTKLRKYPQYTAE